MSSKLSLISSQKKAYDLSLEEWKKWCGQESIAPFHANQIYEWIFAKRVCDPLLFTNLSLSILNRLQESFNWALPQIDSHLISQDESEKYLLKTEEGYLFEMVVMPYENRLTLCISCQVGCKMGCTFCQTGKMGLTRNLTSGEILSQLLLTKTPVTNVVFMGMGEPLDNYEEVVKACKIMIDPKGFNLSSSRVTISTSGLIPAIERLGKELPVRLAISLHSAKEELRSEMMPINRTYSLEALKKVLLEYPAPKRYGITFEYVLIKGKNDSIQDAKKLVKFLHGMKAKVNLIPINHFPGVEMEPSDIAHIRAFQTYLSDRSIPAPVRYSRGQDISGGCGQLATKRAEELHLNPLEVRRKRRHEKATLSQ